MAGYIYIFSNISMPNIYKIGFTNRLPEERANELSSTSSPTPFIVEYSLLIDNPEQVEEEVHSYFSNCRISDNREFFSVNLKDAISHIENKYDEKQKEINLLKKKLQESNESYSALEEEYQSMVKAGNKVANRLVVFRKSLEFFFKLVVFKTHMEREQSLEVIKSALSLDNINIHKPKNTISKKIKKYLKSVYHVKDKDFKNTSPFNIINNELSDLVNSTHFEYKFYLDDIIKEKEEEYKNHIENKLCKKK